MNVSSWLGALRRPPTRYGLLQARQCHLAAKQHRAFLRPIFRPQIHNPTTSPRLRQYNATLAAVQTDGNAIGKLGANPNTPAESQDNVEKRDVPSYEITFTCKPCTTRSTHKISKQGYHKGTILITCPSCKNRHLICDHLKIFRDQSTTIEDILKEKGESIKHGTIGTEGDIEFWNDDQEVVSLPAAEMPKP